MDMDILKFGMASSTFKCQFSLNPATTMCQKIIDLNPDTYDPYDMNLILKVINIFNNIFFDEELTDLEVGLSKKIWASFGTTDKVLDPTVLGYIIKLNQSKTPTFGCYATRLHTSCVILIFAKPFVFLYLRK